MNTATQDKGDLIARHICKISNLGICGRLFGGQLLFWLDSAGAMFARELCRSRTVVTLKFGDTLFHKPVHENEEIKIYGKLTKLGNTSITIFVSAYKFNPETTEEILVCSTDMVFVNVGDDELKRPINEDARLAMTDMLNA